MSRWKRLFHLGGVDDQVDWEIRHHIDERVDDLMDRGLPRDAAVEEARRAFGDVRRVRAEMRSETRGHVRRLNLRDAFRGLAQDIRQAARRLRMRPGFATIAVLVLGLGIGANTAVFSVLEAALLQRPPYPEPERLVMLDLLVGSGETGSADRSPIPWSYPKFEHIRENLRSVRSVAGYWPSTVALTGSGIARRIGAEFVSPSYFDLLGIRPARGRSFAAGEDGRSAAAVALLSDDFWRASFGADPGVVGSTITLDGAAFEVIGVASPGFRGLSGSADVWLPFGGITAIRGPRRLELRNAHWLSAVARLRNGVGLDAARQDAAGASVAFAEEFPSAGGSAPPLIGMEPLLDARVNPVTRLAIAVVSLGAGLLLLIACANVAGLLLVRASARRTELAVRAALGAGRARLVRESLVETALLALAGGLLGALLAFAGQNLIAQAVRYALDTSGTRSLQFLDAGSLAVDGSVLAIGLAAALGTMLVFGLLPALAAARPNITSGLHAASRGGAADTEGGGHTSGSLGIARGALVVGQLALTLVLLSGTGLMAASLARLSGIAVGFDHHGEVLTAGIALASGATTEQGAQFDGALLERISALPGVISVAMGVCPPLTNPCEIAGVLEIDGRSPGLDQGSGAAITYAVSDDYFGTLGIPVRSGVTFGPGHSQGSAPVAVISEAAARTYFPGQSPIGRTISITHSITSETPATVIGVVGDVRYGDPGDGLRRRGAPLEAPMMPTVYLSRRQAPSTYGAVFVRVDRDAWRVLDAVRREVATLAPDAPITNIATLRELHRNATARTRTVLGLLASFALLGLTLSATGLYGVVSYTVVRRTREMGVRIALGASALDVLRLVMRSPATLAVLGVAAGVGASLALTRHVRDLLFEVSAADARVLGAAVAVLLVVGAIAAWVPARRALRVNPATALRSD